MTSAFAYAASRPRGKAATLVFDLECVSNWDRLSVAAQDKLTDRWRRAEENKPLELRGKPSSHPRSMAALDPWTGSVVCLALYDPEQQKGRCLYVAQPTNVHPLRPGWSFEPHEGERDLLVSFWQTLDRNPDARLVGFNSRDFDGAYLFVRSFILDVECTFNVVPYRYSTREHLDLYDVLGVWGARRAPSLDVVCELTGIPTPKRSLSGSEVQGAWDAGRVRDIAQYCADDVVAETAVYHRWERTVGRVFGERRRFN